MFFGSSCAGLGSLANLSEPPGFRVLNKENPSPVGGQFIPDISHSFLVHQETYALDISQVSGHLIWKEHSGSIRLNDQALCKPMERNTDLMRMFRLFAQMEPVIVGNTPSPANGEGGRFLFFTENTIVYIYIYISFAVLPNKCHMGFYFRGCPFQVGFKANHQKHQSFGGPPIFIYVPSRDHLACLQPSAAPDTK